MGSYNQGRGNLIVPAAALLVAAAVMCGCSKKADQSSAPQPAAPEVAATPAQGTPAADAAAQPPSGPVLDASQMGDAKQAMADADAALRQRNYEKAVRTMLAIQQAQLTAQQAEAARQQMYSLQRNLANAIASGDPNAAAAAEILRGAHRH